MMPTKISESELAQSTREIVSRVLRGELAVVENAGEEQVVLLDALDFYLLRALAAYTTKHQEETERPEFSVIQKYLDEEISLGKAAEQLRISRFDLMERFDRLGVPLRLGPSSLEEAQAEVAALRDHG